MKMTFPSWGGWKRKPLGTARCLPSCVVLASHALPFLSSTRRHCRASSFIVLCDAAPRKLYPGGTNTEKKKKKKRTRMSTEQTSRGRVLTSPKCVALHKLPCTFPGPLQTLLLGRLSKHKHAASCLHSPSAISSTL